MTADPLLLPIKAVVHLTSLSRTTIYSRVAAGTFPKPIKLGGRRVAFRRAEIEQWSADPMDYQAHG